MAAPSVRGVGATDDRTNPLPEIPTATQEGDILVCHAFNAHSNPITFPGDWTVFLSADYSLVSIRSAWKRAGASESSPALDGGSASYNWVRIVAYKDCLADGNPIDQVSSDGGNWHTVIAPSITPTVADSFVSMLVLCRAGRTFSGYSGINPDFVEIFDEAGSNRGMASAGGGKDDATATGDRTAVISSGTYASIGAMFNLLPVEEEATANSNRIAMVI